MRGIGYLLWTFGFMDDARLGQGLVRLVSTYIKDASL